MDESWIANEGLVVAGHGVASGRSADPRFPGGTLRLQFPIFEERGLDLSSYHPATINISIAPRRFTPRKAPIRVPGVRWFEGFPPEDFSFFHCRITPPGGPRLSGLVYYPHPETKPEHFQDESVLEILAPFVDGIAPGVHVVLELRGNEIAIS